MDMTGEYRIPAPRQKVWDALNDPEILKQAIPGCETITKLSDTEMSAKVRAKVGPVSARFGGKVTLSDLDPPNGYKIIGEGTGGAGRLRQGRRHGEADRRRRRHEAAAMSSRRNVGGKLAQIGSRLIDATARQMAENFFAHIRRARRAVGRRGRTAAAAPAAAPRSADGRCRRAAAAPPITAASPPPPRRQLDRTAAGAAPRSPRSQA